MCYYFYISFISDFSGMKTNFICFLEVFGELICKDVYALVSQFSGDLVINI